MLGEIVSTMHDDDTTVGRRHRHKERVRPATQYLHRGERVRFLNIVYYYLENAVIIIIVQVCRKTFLFIHGFGRLRLDNIRNSYRIEGVTPHTYLCSCNHLHLSINRTHGNKGRLPVNTFTPAEEIHIVSFIQTHAILLPGRIPGWISFKYY